MFDLFIGVLFISFLISGIIYFLYDYYKDNAKIFFIFCLIFIFCVLALIYYRHYMREHEIYNIVENTNSITEMREEVKKYFED